MMIHCSSLEAAIRYSTTAESRAKIVGHWNAFGSPGGLGCCPFLGGGSVVFYLLFNVFLILCVGSVFVSVLLCITLCPFYFCKRGRERWLICFSCLTDVLLVLMLCRSSSRCGGLVCSG